MSKTAAMGKIKSGKSDGQVGLCMDYLQHGTHKLYVIYVYNYIYIVAPVCHVASWLYT